MPSQPNRLIHEKSPYLLQHAHNPVDWYPWGEEALARAKKDRKLIFLSIGYSTCHWCHVMERESFEDLEVARLLNEGFVSIKVDREERPDLDHYFMGVCQMLTGSGGWPLTVVLTPDGRPFFAGTYFPKTSRFGLPGMRELLPSISSLWGNRAEEVLRSTEAIQSVLAQSASVIQRGSLDSKILKSAFDQFGESFDGIHGGFRPPPKFPTPHSLLFLLRYGKRRRQEKAVRMVEQTLTAMRLGGIYDQLGFGFHRYSTDSQWLVPHFEKMIYDQALLALAYTEAFQATGIALYEQTVREILSYVLRDMTSPGGGFYSAEDADVAGEEGRFYIWKEEEIRSLLTAEETRLALTVFNIDSGGNFEEGTGHGGGQNILHLKKAPLDLAGDLGIPAEEFGASLDRVREKLFAAREKRPRPLKDKKILADWNGLMIAAAARAGQALGVKVYEEAAIKAAEFVLSAMRDGEGHLCHRSIDGQTKISGFLDDYAFFIWGLLELYETVFDVRYLETALRFTRYTLAHFWDGRNGGFYFVSDESTEFPIRPKEIHDGALPSGNSVMMNNLLRLGRMTGDPTLEQKASEIAPAFAETISRSPGSHAHLMSGLDFAAGPTLEIVLAGNLDSTDTQELLRILRQTYLPDKVVLFRPEGVPNPEIASIAPFIKSLTSVRGKATAYVCSNFRCELPITDPQKLRESLSRSIR